MIIQQLLPPFFFNEIYAQSQSLALVKHPEAPHQCLAGLQMP
jgi:hypothetical protein